MERLPLHAIERNLRSLCTMCCEVDIEAICARAVNGEESVSERMRAIFALKSLGGPKAVSTLSYCMQNGDSVLVKHEAAYCLGQMQDSSAIPHLENCLKASTEDVIVRHEAAEALGAIGNPACLEILDQYSSDDYPQEVYETCRLAASRIRMLISNNATLSRAADSKKHFVDFGSVDPAPPLQSQTYSSVEELRRILCDDSESMFERYRAMFSLRNIGDEQSVLALCNGMIVETKSALLRHEIAFVLGQLQHPASITTLKMFLQNKLEHEMVRHEAAEALGSIATSECYNILQSFIHDDENRIVRESAVVALDIAEYNADESAFQYADTVQS